MTTITLEMVQDQILGLQRTQAEEVWIRRDILLHILGAKGQDHIIQAVNMSSSPATSSNLVQAMKQRKKSQTTESTLVCVERAVVLEAILAAVAKKVAGGKNK